MAQKYMNDEKNRFAERLSGTTSCASPFLPRAVGIKKDGAKFLGSSLRPRGVGQAKEILKSYFSIFIFIFFFFAAIVFLGKAYAEAPPWHSSLCNMQEAYLSSKQQIGGPKNDPKNMKKKKNGVAGTLSGTTSCPFEIWPRAV